MNEAPSKRSVFDVVLMVFAAAALAVGMVAAGFAACAAPQATTRVLATAFSNEQDSPFTKDELVQAAVATRDYTVETNSRVALEETIARINLEALWDGRANVHDGAPDMAGVPATETSFGIDALEDAFAAAGERYVLAPDAMSHLDDVFAVVQTARRGLFGACIAACVLSCAVAFRSGKRALACVLTGAGSVVLGAFALLAAWVVFDFNGFFAAFHSLFFAAGTWTFSRDSLLICMYPPEFWMGMGAVWLAATGASSVVCLIMGKLLRARAS